MHPPGQKAESLLEFGEILVSIIQFSFNFMVRGGSRRSHCASVSMSLLLVEV